MKVREPSFFLLSLTPIETVAVLWPALNVTSTSMLEKSPLLAVPAPVRSRTEIPPVGAGAERVNVTAMDFLFSRPLASATETVIVGVGATSSLTMVPLTVAPPLMTYAALGMIVNVTVSLGSTRVSSIGRTVIVAVVCQAAKVRVVPVRVAPVAETV